MVNMAFWAIFGQSRPVLAPIGGSRIMFFAKTFYIPLTQYVSKPLGTLTKKMWKIPNPPLTAHCGPAGAEPSTCSGAFSG